MSTDLQVCFPQTTVLLTSVRIVPGLTPVTIDVIGTDFHAVDQVLINDMPAPEVVVLSKTRLLAQVPPELKNAVLTSVAVTSNELTMSARSLIKFQLGPTSRKVSGILRLMQVFLKILLTTTGVDIFSPGIGGSALKDIGVTFGKAQSNVIVGDFVIAVNSTQRQIVAIQARDPSIPRDERLLSATVTSAAYNQAEAALVVSVELTSQAGRAATANLVV